MRLLILVQPGWGVVRRTRIPQIFLLPQRLPLGSE
jgi:hypothetical protein